MNDAEMPLDPIHELASQMVSLNERAVLVYSPIVAGILENSSSDVQLIESTLDGLLDFAGSEEGLRLFKKLCRHYWDLDQEATAVYVQGYREMWDDD